MLFALGVMAVVGIFGLPQFAPVIASPNDVADGIPLSGRIASYQQAGSGESIAQGVKDLFAPFEAAGETEASSADDSFPPLDIERLENRTASEPRIADLFGRASKQRPSKRSQIELGKIATESRSTQGHDADRLALRSSARERFSSVDEQLDERFSIAETRASQSSERSSRLEFDSRFGRNDREISTTTTEENNRKPFRRTVPFNDSQLEQTSATDRLPQTWREVVSRLNSLGIRDYRLSAGTQPNEFHFNCFFSPRDNPRVTHCFEADANEPLLAVQQVLAQIEEWQNER
jgi:hypothetical protein